MKHPYMSIFKAVKFIIVVALFLPLSGNAGILPDSTLTLKADTSQFKKNHFFKRVEFQLDYLKLLSLPSKFEKKAEVGSGFYLRNNFGMNIEIGYGKLTPENAYKNSDYTSEGFYGRVGINYLYEYQPGILLYIGAKYGASQFYDQGTYTIETPLWQDYTASYKRTNLKADWAEIIIGSESTWKGKFNLGFMTRYRILIDYPKFDDIEVYTIPGYGRTMQKAHLVVTLYIKYVIGF
jgi:hypothetical protein